MTGDTAGPQCPCGYQGLHPEHHDRLVSLEVAGIDGVLELARLADGFDQMPETDRRRYVPPGEWRHFVAEHTWREPAKVELLVTHMEEAWHNRRQGRRHEEDIGRLREALGATGEAGERVLVEDLVGSRSDARSGGDGTSLGAPAPASLVTHARGATSAGTSGREGRQRPTGIRFLES
jgi:hypothetical protein